MRAKTAAREYRSGCPGRLPGTQAEARAASVSLKLLGIFAQGASPSAARSIMQALTEGLGAQYAAFFAAEGDDWRLTFERGRKGGCAMLVPPEIMAPERLDRVRVAAEGAGTWVSVKRRGACVAALFDGSSQESARAFARVAPAAAEFLARSAAQGARNGGTQALLAAVSSLVHDTLNTMTGLSLCLAAYAQNRLAGREATVAEEALLDRALASLELLCREYAGMDRASRAHVGIANAQAMMWSFRDLLGELGIDVRRVAAGQRFSLPPGRQGLALRALVHVAAGMLQTGAFGACVCARTSGGVSSLSVSFRCRSTEAALSNGAIKEAVELVESRGGEAYLAARRGTVRLLMRFAENRAVAL